MCFGTDALYAGPLCHPRSYQAAIHLLYTYWKQEAVLPLQSLINRMSAKPAQRLGLANRGKIAEGYKADLVLLNPEQLKDCSDVMAPDAPSKGIAMVMVNGTVAMQDGVFTGKTAGSLLLW
ncbi:MAG: amidohydrolase family protein, partial [Sphaerochaetaceae bacterium]